MTDWPFGISSGCFYQTPIGEALPHIRDGGFSLIEVCTFPKHLDCNDRTSVESAATTMDRMGIEAFSVHAPFADHIDISSHDAVVRKQSIKEVNIACEAAAILGAKYIVLHPGPEIEGRPQSRSWYDTAHYAADSLNKVANHCHDLGIFLLLENMLPHLIFGHLCDMLFLLGAIKNTNTGTCLDTGHAYLSGEIHTVVNRLSGHLRMLHANDNRGDSDEHLPPGDGNINWRAIVKQLRYYNFQGTIILELNGNGTPKEIMRGARESRKFLRQICRETERTALNWNL